LIPSASTVAELEAALDGLVLAFELEAELVADDVALDEVVADEVASDLADVFFAGELAELATLDFVFSPDVLAELLALVADELAEVACVLAALEGACESCF
jgi:hypothetical protein